VRNTFIAAAAVLALTLAACGGSSNIQPPPASGGFTLASLKSQYAFSMSGLDLSGAFIARIGSFTADGAGNITAGLEDVLDLHTSQQPSIVSITGGTYQIQSNGRGLIHLQDATGSTLQLNIVLESTSSGVLAQTDLNDTSSGTFNLQNSANFSVSELVNQYAFDFSGVSFVTSGGAVAPVSLVGEFNADSNGNITTGVMDTNDGNLPAPSGAITISPGTYQLDSTGNGTAFGRGTMTFNNRSFAFYIVDSTHLFILEEDSFGGSSGDAFQQVPSLPAQNSAFASSFVFLVNGASTRGSQGPVARAARFTADGSGAIGSISFDENNDGSYRHISQGSNISQATYSIDTAYPGSGRGSLTFTDSSGGTYVFIFYLISGSQGFVQDTSRGIIADGPFYAQTGTPFAVASSAGNYVFNWSGVQLGSTTAVPFQEDFVGQYALSNASSNNITGVTDYVELGLSAKTLFSNIGVGGTLTINGDSTANNLYKFALGGSPSTTINFQAYFANANTVLVVSSDSNRTTSGILHQQSQ
jgi:hypothetical protein